MASLRGRLAVPLLTAILLGTSSVLAGERFPPYLGDPERLPPDVRIEVADIWNRRTVSRVATGRPARVSRDLYEVFVDLPEVTAAAGRHLGVGAYRVARRGPDLFDIADGEGARGSYRVISRAAGVRVLVARVQRTAWLLGEVHGAFLTRLEFREERDADGRPYVTQRVESVVRIDHRIAAFIARVLLPLFPGYADRKIAEAFNIAARVSAWSVEEPGAFCRWLATEPDGARHREAFARHLPACRAPLAGRAGRRGPAVTRVFLLARRLPAG